VVVGTAILIGLSALPVLSGSALATVAAGNGAKTGTCKQLTKNKVQPLLATPITKVKVMGKGGATGQTCVFSGSGNTGDGEDIDVEVILGSEAKTGFKEEVNSMHPKVAVPGVGTQADRSGGDYQIDPIQGNEYCSVSVGSDESVPGVSALETNGTSDIPEKANAIVASALGTLCNRIYGKGHTTPSLGGLSSLATSTPSS
jgi:hypothetical protein